MSLTDRVLEALKSAIQLESRLTAMADHVSGLAKDVRDIDKRLVRVETVIEFGMRGRASGGAPPGPPAFGDHRK